MNYMNNYINFYKGENRKEIYKLFYTFMEAIRVDDDETLKRILHKNCTAELSTTGCHKGLPAIIHSLRWPGPSMNIRRNTFWNFVSRSNENRSQSYAYSQCVYAIKNEKYVYPFVFGGHYCLSYVKDEFDNWKIISIKYDLVFESGNNCFVKDKWKLIDYNRYYGHKPVIRHYLDAPWEVITDDVEEQSEEEVIMEILMLANYVEDTGAFEELHKYYTHDFVVDLSARKNKTKNSDISSGQKFVGITPLIDFVKEKSHKEPKLQHTICYGDLEVRGEEARAWAFRSEYNRLYNRIYTMDNIHSSVTTLYFDILFRKENNEWKISSIGSYPMVKFMPLDDDCLQYDDYICNGVKWSKYSKDEIVSTENCIY